MLTTRFFHAGVATLCLLAAAPALAQQTIGPGGEAATPASAVTLTDAEVATLTQGHHSAALLWHTTSDFTKAVTAGATDEFTRLGIKVVATTDAGFDAAKQKSDVETVMALKPDIILSLPLDPITAAEAFRPASEAGVKLVFLSNVPKGYVQGKDYVAIVTDDLAQMGKHAADALAKSIGDKGKIAWVFHDAKYYVTNQRDNAFKAAIQKDHPGIAIVDEKGIADPARAEDVAQALLAKTPDLDGVYVTWAEPAEGVLSALRAAGNTHVKIVTLDLSEPLGVEMAKGGSVVALVADEAYQLGKTMADAGAYGLLGKAAPAFIVVPALTVDRSNLNAGWNASLHRDAPQAVLNAAK